MRWLLALSIRWKLQFGFFMVTMITTIFNRLLATSELEKMIEIARTNNVAVDIIQKLQQNRDTYIFNSFWESGLEFLFQFFIISVVASIFVKPIKALCSALQSAKDGDLTQDVHKTSFDEIGTLEDSFNDMLKKLNFIMRRIQESGKGMAQSVYQIAKISHEISEISSTEQKRSGEVSTATKHLHEISDSVKNLAEKGIELARETKQQAVQGNNIVQENIEHLNQTADKVNRATTEINELSISAEQIHSIVNTITTIAEQTNLLSLNAAIEAARAGEAGRGFAVVADEVRNLAKNTSSSLGEITTIVASVNSKVWQVSRTMSDVVHQVQNSQNVASETRSIIEEMRIKVSDSATANQEIYTASHSQSQQLMELNQTLEKLFDTLGESATKVDTTASIGDDLLGVTDKLNSLMSEFRFDQSIQIEPSDNDQRRGPRLDEHLWISVDVDGVCFEGVSNDFSLTGIQIRLVQPLGDKKNVTLKILKPNSDAIEYQNQTPLEFSGTIMWQRMEKDRYLYGIEYTTLNTRQSRFLNECFEFFNKNTDYNKLKHQTAA